ncbi:MAG: hypothetical protein ACXVGO_13700, partial [Mycobacterium sp.]
MAIVVASLNAAETMRLDLGANVARDSESSHVSLGRAPQVTHRKRPALKLARCLHCLLDLFDQRRHGFLAQRHAAIRAEEWCVNAFGLR